MRLASHGEAVPVSNWQSGDHDQAGEPGGAALDTATRSTLALLRAFQVRPRAASRALQTSLAATSWLQAAGASSIMMAVCLPVASLLTLHAWPPIGQALPGNAEECLASLQPERSEAMLQLLECWEMVCAGDAGCSNCLQANHMSADPRALADRGKPVLPAL